MFIVSLLISMFSLQCSCTHLQLDGHTDTEADSRPLAYFLSVWGLNCFTGFSTAQRNDGDGDDDDDDDDGLKSGEGGMDRMRMRMADGWVMQPRRWVNGLQLVHVSLCLGPLVVLSSFCCTFYQRFNVQFNIMTPLCIKCPMHEDWGWRSRRSWQVERLCERAHTFYGAIEGWQGCGAVLGILKPST